MKYYFLICLSLVLNSPLQAQEIHYADIQDGDYQLHFAYAGNPQKPAILFVHGTPGSWDAFEAYLADKQLQNDFFMVSVDRLGWGKSVYKKDQVATQFAQHSEAISLVFDYFDNSIPSNTAIGLRNWTLVGHSYGASLVPFMALQYPQNVTKLLILAGSQDPNLSIRWYNHVANTLLVGWLLPKSLKRSNSEIIALKTQITSVQKQIEQQPLTIKTTVMHGLKDKLVSPKNLAYIERHWINSSNKKIIKTIPLENSGHFFVWKNRDDVIQQLYDLTSD